MPPTLTTPSAQKLADYTTPALMVPQLQSQGRAAVIVELCALLQREGRLHDLTTFSDAVMRREQLSSTSIACGWALPHARLNGLPRLTFTLARSSQPFVWSTEALCPVHTVFLFAAPEPEAKTYLNLISAVARLSQNSALVDQLRRAPDARNMFAVLQQVPVFRATPVIPASAARRAPLLKV